MVLPRKSYKMDQRNDAQSSVPHRATCLFVVFDNPFWTNNTRLGLLLRGYYPNCVSWSLCGYDGFDKSRDVPHRC